MLDVEKKKYVYKLQIILSFYFVFNLPNTFACKKERRSNHEHVFLHYRLLISFSYFGRMQLAEHVTVIHSEGNFYTVLLVNVIKCKEMKLTIILLLMSIEYDRVGYASVFVCLFTGCSRIL